MCAVVRAVVSKYARVTSCRIVKVRDERVEPDVGLASRKGVQ